MRQRASYKELVNKYLPNKFKVVSSSSLHGSVLPVKNFSELYYKYEKDGEFTLLNVFQGDNSAYNAWKFAFEMYAAPISFDKVNECLKELDSFIVKQSKSAKGCMAFPTAARILYQHSNFEKIELVKGLKIHPVNSSNYSNKTKNTMFYNMFVEKRMAKITAILDKYK